MDLIKLMNVLFMFPFIVVVVVATINLIKSIR